jgi:hypothetical protein
MSAATVVLPAPEGPTRATTSPGAIENVTSLNTSGSSGAYRNSTRSSATAPRTGRRSGSGRSGSATVGCMSSSSNTRCAAPIAS